MRLKGYILVPFFALLLVVSPNVSIAQEPLDIRINSLLERIRALENEENPDFSPSISQRNTNFTAAEINTDEQISVEERLDTLLFRLRNLESSVPNIAELQSDPDPSTKKNTESFLKTESETKNERRTAEFSDRKSLAKPVFIPPSKSSLPIENPPMDQATETLEFEDMDIRINKLLNRLDRLEKTTTLTEEEGDRVPQDTIDLSTEVSANSSTLSFEEENTKEKIPELSLPTSELSEESTRRNAFAESLTYEEVKKEPKVGSRVDELLRRLDNLENSWSMEKPDFKNDPSEQAISESQTKSEENPFPDMDSFEALETDSGNADEHERIQDTSGVAVIAEETIIPVENKPSNEVEARLDFLFKKLEKLEGAKQRKQRAGQASKKDNKLRRVETFTSSRKPFDRESNPVMNSAGNQPPFADPKEKKISPRKGWDLFVLRELALVHAPELLVKKAQVSTSQQSVPSIEFGDYPKVKGKVSYNDYTKIASFQTWDSEPYGIISYGLEGSWVLYDGHKTRKQIKTAELEIQEAQWALVVEEQKVLRQLIDHFFDALSAQIETYFLSGIDRLIRERLRVYEKQVASGIQDRMLLNKTMRELENLRSQHLTAEHSVESAKTEISFLINADNNFWAGYQKFLSPPSFFMNYKFDPAKSPQVALGESGVQVAESRYEEIKTGMSPILELTSKAGYQGKNKIGIDSQGQEFSFGLSLTLPITDYYHTKSKLLKAREEVKQAEAKRHNLLRQQENQYQSELLKLELAEKNLLLQKELWSLQKNRLDDMAFVSGRGLFDKSSALLEEEELLRRELSREQANIKTLRHKYLIDLIK